MTLLIHQDAIEQVLSVDLAISVIEETFRQAGEAQVENPARMCMPIGDGFMRFGPAALHHRRVAGFKLARARPLRGGAAGSRGRPGGGGGLGRRPLELARRLVRDLARGRLGLAELAAQPGQ